MDINVDLEIDKYTVGERRGEKNSEIFCDCMPHGFCFPEALEKEGMTRLCSVLAHSQALQERRRELWGHLPIKAFLLSHLLSAPGLSAWTSPCYTLTFKKSSFVTVCDLQVLSLDEKGSSRVKSDICINIFLFFCLFVSLHLVLATAHFCIVLAHRSCP